MDCVKGKSFFFTMLKKSRTFVYKSKKYNRKNYQLRSEFLSNFDQCFHISYSLNPLIIKHIHLNKKKGV